MARLDLGNLGINRSPFITKKVGASPCTFEVNTWPHEQQGIRVWKKYSHHIKVRIWVSDTAS